MRPPYVLKHLHSTMYLFKLLSGISAFDLSLHLHSTMYLFKLTCVSSASSSIHIYIPPCIYLNGDKVAKIREEKHLHSTMYLFKLDFFRFSIMHKKIYIPPCIYLNFLILADHFPVCFIYIPPCIYLNSELLRPVFYPSQIYIPPCIYLNNSSIIRSRGRMSFTFHHVSI